MKHNLKITAVLLAMFLVTQLIGLYVVNHYLNEENKLPYGLEPPKPEKETDYYSFFTAIIIAFVVAIFLFLFLIKFKIEFILRLWFFVVVVMALSISLTSFLSPFVKYALIFSAVIAVPLAVIKTFGRNFFVHNFVELLIYPGIAAIFVPILNVPTTIAFLVIISVYDIWAVWHSGIMQKMAKYQINTLKVFSGFFVPYLSKKTRQKIRKWKKTLKKSELKKKKVKMDIAILGGGDVVFPIITAGVMLKTLGFYSAIFVIIGATLGLTYLFARSEKKKFYPAMPFISAGIFIAIGVGYLIRFLH